MHIINRSLSLTCLTLLADGLAMAQAQQTAAPNAEVEALRTSVEQQKAEMDQLREELRRESELRKKQEELLHTVIQKLNELTATRGQGLSETEKKTAIVPVALTTSATDASQTAATSPDTDLLGGCKYGPSLGLSPDGGSNVSSKSTKPARNCFLCDRVYQRETTSAVFRSFFNQRSEKVESHAKAMADAARMGAISDHSVDRPLHAESTVGMLSPSRR